MTRRQASATCWWWGQVAAGTAVAGFGVAEQKAHSTARHGEGASGEDGPVGGPRQGLVRGVPPLRRRRLPSRQPRRLRRAVRPFAPRPGRPQGAVLQGRCKKPSASMRQFTSTTRSSGPRRRRGTSGTRGRRRQKVSPPPASRSMCLARPTTMTTTTTTTTRGEHLARWRGGGSDGGGSSRRSLRRSIRSSGGRGGLATTGAAFQDATPRRAGRRRRTTLPTPSTSSSHGRCRETPAGRPSERQVRVQSQSPATAGSTTTACSSAWLLGRNGALSASCSGQQSEADRRIGSSGSAGCRCRRFNDAGTRQ